ncbi:MULTISPECIES: S24 family peptidase [Tatumella]|uniref:S24 family peptidase n=1 Tax=Tatumella punctata TaxID=399969 RepID=A0ABW1VNB7_9GAMM
MTEEGIADGDMLIVDSSLTAGAGDIVVASLAGQVYGLLYISEE